MRLTWTNGPCLEKERNILVTIKVDSMHARLVLGTVPDAQSGQHEVSACRMKLETQSNPNSGRNRCPQISRLPNCKSTPTLR